MFRLATLILGILFYPLGGLAADGDFSVTLGKRVALVIGNGNYRDERDRLPNPANDARSIAKKLRALNFDVLEALDLDLKGMETALLQFEQMLSADLDSALVFYAGHGMEHNGQNYLFPVDAKLDSEFDINRVLVRISEILEIMQISKVSTRLIILDACRNNPLKDRFIRSIQTTRAPSIGRGLAVIDAAASGGQGTFVAYATGPGEIAEDGDGDHSPFTAALLRHLDAPGLNTYDLMQLVTKTVAEATDGSQTPWFSSSLREHFVFNRGKSIPPKKPDDDDQPSDKIVAPTPDAVAFDSDLTSGDRRQVLSTLNALGYDVPESAKSFDLVTRRAIAEWQRDSRFKSTGFLTQQELKKLLNEKDPEVPPPLPPDDPEGVESDLSLTKQQRVELQFSLSRLGLYSGARLDGIFGPRSREAISTWQRENSLAETGYLTEIQVAWLYLAAVSALEPFRVDRRREIDRPAGSTFRDCASCPDMIVLPGGQFSMGSSSGGTASERPVRQVDIAKFALGKLEVKSTEWAACARDGQCRPVSSTSDHRPVVKVTWQDTQHYVDWLRGVTGENYYLPSEAEWEYAARAGTKTVYAIGNRISIAEANFDDSQYSPERADKFRGSTLVGAAFPANAFGLYDMHGNVREWVQDRWHASYQGAPRDNRAWVDGTEIERVQRGGSWHDGPGMLRSAARAKAAPDSYDAYTGFRVARMIGKAVSAEGSVRGSSLRRAWE